PGSLLDVLEPFAAAGIDLNRIGSRPTRTGMGRYYVLLECAGHPSDEPLRTVLRLLPTRGVRVRVLGVLTGPTPTRLAAGTGTGTATATATGTGTGTETGRGTGRAGTEVRTPRR
nr:hypothetical protein [Micromonospora sp. DSM 115978]